MIKSLFNKYKDFGILLIRIGIGLSFALIHGWGKISAGPELWAKLGIGNG